MKRLIPVEVRTTIDAESADRLQAFADQSNTTVQRMVRAAIYEWMDRWENREAYEEMERSTTEALQAVLAEKEARVQALLAEKESRKGES